MNSTHIMIILFQNICKKGYNKHFRIDMFWKHTFCQCLNFNIFLNFGVFQKYYAVGGSMNGIGNVINTLNFIADVCLLCFWHVRETFVVVVSHLIGDIDISNHIFNDDLYIFFPLWYIRKHDI